MSLGRGSRKSANPDKKPARIAQTERRNEVRHRGAGDHPDGPSCPYRGLFADLTIAQRGARVSSCNSQITIIARSGNTARKVSEMPEPMLHSSDPTFSCANTPFWWSGLANSAKQIELTAMKIVPTILFVKSAANPANSIMPTDPRTRAAATRAGRTFTRTHRRRTGTPACRPSTPVAAAATCENSGETNAAPTLILSVHTRDEWTVGTSKQRDEQAILRAFRLPRSSTTGHQNTEHPGVTQMRRFRNHADGCHTLSGRLGQCRLS